MGYGKNTRCPEQTRTINVGNRKLIYVLGLAEMMKQEGSGKNLSKKHSLANSMSCFFDISKEVLTIIISIMVNLDP